MRVLRLIEESLSGKVALQSLEGEVVYLAGAGGSHWVWGAESRELEDPVWKGSLRVWKEVPE